MGNLRIWLLSLFVFGIIAFFPVSESSPSHMHFQKRAQQPQAKAAVTTKLPDFKVRGTNLGGWLLVEGWIKPSLFDGIPNKDFLVSIFIYIYIYIYIYISIWYFRNGVIGIRPANINITTPFAPSREALPEIISLTNFSDGTVLEFKSVTTQKYLCAENGGGGFLEASCNDTCGWDQFRLWRIKENLFRFRVPKNQFVGLDGIEVVAVVTNATESETFEIIKESKDSNRVRIRASNGFYLQAKTEKSVTADIAAVIGWENNDPTVFNLTIVSHIDGDFQLQNGYGAQAARVMQDHYDTFIDESDFKFMNDSGVNAVRIPVGWWTTKDPNPPSPFVSGTLKALDKAFEWAKTYGLKVVLDLHAAPDSQNGVAHSTTRDGSLEWGKTYANIEETLEVIEFFAKRYGKHKSLYGFELINEPLYPYVTLKSLEDYYRAAHKVVRKYNPTVYVIFSIRLSFTEAEVPPIHELFPLANSLDDDKIVVDVHWYSLYYDIFTGLSAQEHIDYIKYNRSQQMADLLDNSGKALINIGEWSCGWGVENPTTQELKDFANAQIQVYDQATFGWTFWTWKNVENNWSLKWLIQNTIINLRS
ncbi:putative glucan 1,3-beta-glucosidase A [Senna tora]|uniref:Putative glucan 1,3-beta-glucosidase A n=1 Tax=Senna tora TaxID=362788 RepID=A0A834T5S2_9FABA|nr:putative glucan 1,3-beta-glucosidase A [Senna tora]